MSDDAKDLPDAAAMKRQMAELDAVGAEQAPEDMLAMTDFAIAWRHDLNAEAEDFGAVEFIEKQAVERHAAQQAKKGESDGKI